MLRTKTCPKCGGDCEFRDDEGDWACIQCAKRVSKQEMKEILENKNKWSIAMPVPLKPDVTGKGKKEYNWLIHDYYEENKEHILAEIEILGETATRKRWNINSGTWTGLKKRWGLPIHNMPGQNQHQRARKLSNKPLKLPSFPEFNEEWPSPVKVAWLNSYAEMAK